MRTNSFRFNLEELGGALGVYHALLIRDVKLKKELAVVGAVAMITLTLGNLAFGFGAGILLHYLLMLDTPRIRYRFLEAVRHHRKKIEVISEVR